MGSHFHAWSSRAFCYDMAAIALETPLLRLSSALAGFEFCRVTWDVDVVIALCTA